MDVLLAFAAALVSLRLTAELVGAATGRGARPSSLAWAASLACVRARARRALAWGAAAGWDDRSFRVYYLFGGLLTAALLGAGSLLRVGRPRGRARRRCSTPGSRSASRSPCRSTAPVTGSSIPDAPAHLALFPARVARDRRATSRGTVAAVGVALAGIRRRPVGNGLIVAGVVVAAVGSALAGPRRGRRRRSSPPLAAALLYGGLRRARR